LAGSNESPHVFGGIMNKSQTVAEIREYVSSCRVVVGSGEHDFDARSLEMLEVCKSALQIIDSQAAEIAQLKSRCASLQAHIDEQGAVDNPLRLEIDRLTKALNTVYKHVYKQAYDEPAFDENDDELEKTK
jgi:hypothetical protein